MDWTQIITVLIGAGGVTGLFLISEKKASAAISNLLKQYNTLQELYDKLQSRFDIETDKVGKLYTEIEDLHNKLDDANTRAAVGKLKRCDRIACPHRLPPLSDEWCADEVDFKDLKNSTNEPEAEN